MDFDILGGYMLLLPTIVLTLSSISGASGIALSVKSAVDTMDASSTNRYTQERNERNLLRFEACSKKLDASLNKLGEQRMVIAKNFNVFINAFERIHNRPEFSTKEQPEFPVFNFEEIKNVSVVASVMVGTAGGAVIGSVLGAVAQGGTTAAIIAYGKASTGARIAGLRGAAKTKAALAALGGGAKAVGGGGVALGTLALNAATLGVGTLVEGIAMAYAGSLAKKEADKAQSAMQDYERIISNAIKMQISITNSADEMSAASARICNGIYKSHVLKLKKLVTEKNDWNMFSKDEKLLVENCILIVQILHYLNNIPMYRVISVNDKEEVEEIEPNTDAVRVAIHQCQEKARNIK